MRYLPFIIISVILYALFFYHNQQPELLATKNVAPEEKISEKVIPLDFKETTPSKIPSTQLAPQETISQAPQSASITTSIGATPTPSIAPVTIEKTQSIAIENGNATKQQQAKQQLYTLLKATEASEVALLKGEYYEQYFYLDLPAPPIPSPQVKKGKIQPKKAPEKELAKKPVQDTQPSVTSELLSQKSNTNIANEEPVKKDKVKRSFKKQVKPVVATHTTGLQEAIAVSGNKPLYPTEAKKAKLQGTATATFVVNMRGKTKQSKITHSSGHQILDNALLEFIDKERFMPALDGIEKVTSEQQLSFKYELK
ncbi:hypothetical protein CW745_06860 [Psychromonas sp. psych-6C06]|uniref:energy transducer TonB n=1 Tax=Psychromonas sp. psych-6C06 TaxID=2058089 RepID=UPI000C33C4F9|nr:energy transducer TonB [Psychromonas sp. psych-6C06]PKF63131.1 hypothetical protein CW745_06860 [Psychromonas sp. psych-6C06]